MWVRFNQEYMGNPLHSVVEVGPAEGQEMIDSGLVTRCTGPDGIAFGEAAPEDVQKVIDLDQEQE
ncbi:MAG: hypothetical protein KCHDKBKB_00772 [Elusimicrobia bacterium]|nr:hypothetical protein [Elusimicrobiota bacterium]